MALKLKLKADEKLIVGRTVIRNGSKAAEIFIENNVPILREKDILKEEEATSFCRRLYFLVQLMYLDEEQQADCRALLQTVSDELLTAVPSTKPYLDDITGRIDQGDFYHALKNARKLVEYEDSLLAGQRKV